MASCHEERSRVDALWVARKVKLFWVNVGYVYLKTAEILGDILTKQINTHHSKHEKEDGQQKADVCHV